ncbi:hypothetical protein AVEN_188335-1 [Araneus ventricosus]|uniref:Uncharacterized protein n=1 Tax=Araneus ventricosus TaxID=182803 RepID=A0A4Y2MJM0_ARAVE|nr:hypothetical protein AVEN_188335-1 [Araneus ventricosus]
MTHLHESWLHALPSVLHDIRTIFKEDLVTFAAELVYGSPLKLPGEFFSSMLVTAPASSFSQTLRHHVSSFRHVPSSNRCSGQVFVIGDLLNLLKASRVFLRIARIRKSLEPPYAGPYKALSRTSSVFTVEVDGRPVTISIRLKAAHAFPDEVASRISSPISTCRDQKST